MIDLILSWAGLAAIVTVFCAGAIQGSTGFGFNMLAAPLLALIDPAFVPGAMLLMATAVCIWGAVQERSDIHWPDLAITLTARLIAAALAAYLLGLFAPEVFAGLFGFAVLMAVAISLWGRKIQTTPPALFIAGFVSGLMGTLTSIGAPPMALVYQNTAPKRMRATLNAYFFIGGLISIAALTVAGRMGVADLKLAGTLVPFAFAGFLASGWGRRMMDKNRVRPVVLAISSVSALVLLARAF